MYLIDTSTVKWAYVDGAKLTQRCRYLLSRAKGRIYVAEITLLEVASALASMVRDKKITAAQFAAADRRFWRDVADGKLIVVSLPSSELIACRELLILVGITAGRNIRTQDAMVAYTARRVALEKRQVVTLLTCDKKLANVVKTTAAFARLVKARYLHPA
jgi:predicted nucleic acid-binding protein